jgi:hypothetical protein
VKKVTGSVSIRSSAEQQPEQLRVVHWPSSAGGSRRAVSSSEAVATSGRMASAGDHRLVAGKISELRSVYSRPSAGPSRPCASHWCKLTCHRQDRQVHGDAEHICE